MGFYKGDKLRVASNCEEGVVLPPASGGTFEIVDIDVVTGKLAAFYPDGNVRYLLQSTGCGLNKLWAWAVPGRGFHSVEGFADRSIRR
jgi:hypothetical protein